MFGSFGTKNGVNGDTITGAVPSIQNSGFRRLINLGFELLLLAFREELNVDAVTVDGIALLLAPAIDSSTGR